MNISIDKYLSHHHNSFDCYDKEFISYFVNTIDEMICDNKLDFSFDENQYIELLDKLEFVAGFKEGYIYKVIQEMIQIIRKDKDDDRIKDKSMGKFLDILMFLRACRNDC